MEYVKMCNAGGDKVRWCKFASHGEAANDRVRQCGCECVWYSDVAGSDKVMG